MKATNVELANVGIFTHTPMGERAKKSLLAEAEHVGNILIECRTSFYTPHQRVPFHEITYFFDKDYREIGYIVFKDGPCESVYIHDPPRMWHPDFLAKSQIRENRWNKKFDDPRTWET